jgi:hypothetical protein
VGTVNRVAVDEGGNQTMVWVGGAVLEGTGVSEGRAASTGRHELSNTVMAISDAAKHRRGNRSDRLIEE